MEIGAYGGVDTRRTFATFAQRTILSAHLIHIGRRAAQVGKIAFEVGHLDDLLHFAQNAFLRSAHDELSLMGRDGAEGAAAKTSTMEIDRELNHLVRGNALILILGMGQSGIRKVKRAVNLLGRHGRVRRIDYNIAVAQLLQDALRMELVTLLLNVAEIGSIVRTVLQAVFVRIQLDVVCLNASRNVLLALQADRLAYGVFLHQCLELLGGAVSILAAMKKMIFQRLTQIGRG